MKLKQSSIQGVILGFMLSYVVLMFHIVGNGSEQQRSFELPITQKPATESQSQYNHHQLQEPRCALLFFGLPRSFESIVLPSVVKNVLIPNSKCDVYAHAGMRQQEDAGRSGTGGTIDPKAIFLLKQKVMDVTKARGIHREPHVAITTDTEQDFWRENNATIQKYHTSRDANGKLLYFPWKKKSYTFPETMDNVVRQWHSIQSVWNLMEMESQKLGVTYSRIAMLRSDVLYVTPIDIYQLNKTFVDTNNDHAIVPGFAMFPVNDRMIAGPSSAVKIWATERFSRLDDHVLKVEPGIGMHSEQFLHDAIFPAMEKSGSKVVTNNDICFFRVRSDGSIRTFDCQMHSLNTAIRKMNTKRLVERVLERKCIRWEENCKGQRCVICPEEPHNATA